MKSAACKAVHGALSRKGQLSMMLGWLERDGEDTEPVSQGRVDCAELSIGKTM